MILNTVSHQIKSSQINSKQTKSNQTKPIEQTRQRNQINQIKSHRINIKSDQTKSHHQSIKQSIINPSLCLDSTTSVFPIYDPARVDSFFHPSSIVLKDYKATAIKNELHRALVALAVMKTIPRSTAACLRARYNMGSPHWKRVF